MFRRKFNSQPGDPPWRCVLHCLGDGRAGVACWWFDLAVEAEMVSDEMLFSPVAAQRRERDDAVDVSLATALQRTMSFAEDRKRQHTPSTANRPRRLRKAEPDFEEEQKENSNPSVSSSASKVTPSRLACIKQLEQEMTCSVCLDICVRPCTTPCGHDFCRKCLKQALQHQRRCPKCRANIPASAPICINTVLWNTIKLLFPQHAANAPESPADAILTPSAANRAAMVQVLAAVPNAIMRHAVNAPFNPPRRTRPLSPSRPAAQRMPPSWLEGATRDSDPPVSVRQHRLALSSRQPQQQQAHQQTLPQALGRWETRAVPPPQGLDLDDPHVQAAQPILVQPRRQTGRFGQFQLQQSAEAPRNRLTAQASLLDNLQRRLDILPVPDVLASPHHFPAAAAGMEHSPSLRVRAFSRRPQQQQGQAQQPSNPTAAAAGPSNMFMQRNHNVPHHHLARQPVLDHPLDEHSPAAAHAQHHAEQHWLVEGLPDTPEAPRAATAAQNQAVADALFEAAAGESALGDGDIQAEPSWLDDAAAYDAAAAEIDADGLDALEILSDDDHDISAQGSRSTRSGLALTGFDQLMLSSDSEEDDSVIAGSVVVEEEPRLPASATPQHARLTTLQRALRIPRFSRAWLEQQQRASAATTAAAQALNPGPSASSAALASGRAAQPGAADVESACSPPQLAAGHSGLSRLVLSDVTAVHQDCSPPPQAPEEPAADSVADRPFALQRRCRLPFTLPQVSQGEHASASTAAACAPQQPLPHDDAARPHNTQQLLDAEHAPVSAVAAAAGSTFPVARCTRSQAKRNKQPNLSQVSAVPAVNPNDDTAMSRSSQLQGHNVASSSAAMPTAMPAAADEQATSSNSLSEQAQQAAPTGRTQRLGKSRPRLQLNRQAK